MAVVKLAQSVRSILTRLDTLCF